MLETGALPVERRPLCGKRTRAGVSGDALTVVAVTPTNGEMMTVTETVTRPSDLADLRDDELDRLLAEVREAHLDACAGRQVRARPHVAKVSLS